MNAPHVARLAGDRKAGYLDAAGLRDALHDAGFPDGAAAASAVEHLIADGTGELELGDVVAGCVEAPDPGRALNNTARLLSLPERPACPVAADALCFFLGASQNMADLLCRRPDLLARLGRPFDVGSAQERYLQAGAAPDADAALRREQQADLLAIAWSDLIEGLDVEQVTILLSRLADAVLHGAATGLDAPRHFAIVALGKLGGMELNYSSDIDLIFVRPDDVTDQATADQVARALVQRLMKQTEDGHLYRTDMRLRPEGASGTLTRTVSSCLAYYEAMGRPWERQMLTKARMVVESGEAGERFLTGTRAWILECGLDAGAIRQFKRLKTATEARARRGGGTDLKQAPGGIRDIEVIVQFQSLVHAPQNPWLVCNSTLHGLERLRVAGVLTSLEAARLRGTYLFHRRLENRLQVMHRVQTHQLPVDRAPLARLMDKADVDTFDGELAEHRRRVREVFDRRFANAFKATEGPAARISELLLEPEPDVDAFDEALAALGFREPAVLRGALCRAASPVSRFLPTSPRLRSHFASLAPALLERLALASDPEAAGDRFERMTRGVGAREVLYAQLEDEPELLEMLCDLARGSPFLADTLAGEPQIFDAFVDALLTGMRGRRRRRERLARRDDSEGDPWLRLSDYKKLETLRIGSLDLQESLPTQTVLAELSQLCIDVLRAAFDIVRAEQIERHGTPMTTHGVSARVPADMVVVAMGKVGGLEANYASDADLVFVHSGDGETGDGTSNRVFFTQVAEEFIAHVQGQRGNPRLYKVDTRLRPEGNQGPLVTSLRALQKYYSGPRAALFEFQALLKARVVAGDAALGQRVLATLRSTLRKLELPDDLAEQLREMRGKIEARAHGHDLKRGTGGMVDIEQLTQYLQLRSAARHPAVLVQETPRALERLGAHDVLDPEVARWLHDTYMFFRRVETRLQIAFGVDTKEVPADPAAARDLALRLGYSDTTEGDAGHDLLVALEEASSATRARYEQLLAD